MVRGALWRWSESVTPLITGCDVTWNGDEYAMLVVADMDKAVCNSGGKKISWSFPPTLGGAIDGEPLVNVVAIRLEP